MKILSYTIVIFFAFTLFAKEYEIEPSDECATCHENIFEQWQSSMHAKSTRGADELYRKMMDWAVEDTKGKATKLCTQCHTPYMKLLKTDPLVTVQVSERPVDCNFCHSISDLDSAPVFSQIKYGPRTKEESDYHKVEMRTHFKDEKLCMTCHGELSNPQGIPVCTTGDEFYTGVAEKKTCQDCHMPIVLEKENEHRAHTFLGPHNPDFIKGSLGLEARTENRQLYIEIDNSKTPHGFPTGSPLRQVILKVVGYDANNTVVFENWINNPLNEDKQSVFMKMFEDKEKNFPVPPWRAANIKFDSRLKNGEKRMLTYIIPEGTNSIMVKLVFRLAPKMILDKLKIDDPFINAAHLIDQIELKMN